MSKNKLKQPEQKTTGKAPAPKVAPGIPMPGEFTIPKPMLWLALATLVVYISSISFGYTELDDAIFIRDFQDYNRNLQNLITAFQRGLFDAVKDPYYRPLFSDSIILNFQLAANLPPHDGGTIIWSYHLVNILLHITSVILLFKLFRKLEIKELTAFLLSLIFAVHPVLSQAVAWIPGRNDTMLAVFVLAYFIYSISYSDNGKAKNLLLACLFLLLAFFTKETAVFAPPAAFILVVFVRNKKWQEKRSLVQYGLWAACFLVWFLARAMATTAASGIASAHALTDMAHRLPVVAQYIGKIFLPFNLSVFPTQQDTVYYYGIISIVLLVAIIWLYKERDMKIILSGIGIFLLFLMPALLVPDNLNQQTFEHRLYLPMIGILLVLSQTILFHNKLAAKQLFLSCIAVCGLFAIINFMHQKSFENPRDFWTQAAETSPHSAYAVMMLAARLDKDEIAHSEELFRRAYQLNPKEKYLNFYMGDMLQKKDSVAASEKYLLAEKNSSNYYQCDFLLARVYMERKDFNAAIASLGTYLERDPRNTMANNNLLLLYLQTQQPDKAKAQIKHMQQIGLEVPGNIAHQLGM